MEERKDDSRLRSLLEAVRDVQDSGYIGMQDAHNVVKVRRKIYETPQEISRSINETLDLTPQDYRVTPVRLAAILRITKEGARLNEKYLEDFPEAKIEVPDNAEPSVKDLVMPFEGPNNFQAWLFGLDYLMGSPKIALGQAIINRKATSSLFEQARENGIKTDEEFKEYLASETFDAVNDLLSGENFIETGIRTVQLYRALMKADVNNIFSQDRLRKRERALISSMESHYINWADQLHRMKNDGERSLDYSKRAVANYIHSLAQEPGSLDYNTLVSDLVARIAQSKKGLDFLVKEGLTDIAEDRQEKVDSLSFILKTVRHNRSFVEGILS